MEAVVHRWELELLEVEAEEVWIVEEEELAALVQQSERTIVERVMKMEEIQEIMGLAEKVHRQVMEEELLGLSSDPRLNPSTTQFNSQIHYVFISFRAPLNGFGSSDPREMVAVPSQRRGTALLVHVKNLALPAQPPATIIGGRVRP